MVAQLKNIQKLIFPAFGTIYLRFGGQLFSSQNSIKEYLKIDFSSFWHDLGFWWQLVSIQILISKSIQKLIFSVFGTILVLVAACFYSKFPLKKYLKN